MEHKARTGGILTIIAGSFCVFHLLGTVFAIYMFSYMFSGAGSPYWGYAQPEQPPAEFFTMMTVFYGAIGLFMTLCGVLAIVGGVFALKRKRWGLALAGAVAGTVTFFPLGIAAIIFVSMAQPEFSASGSSAVVG